MTDRQKTVFLFSLAALIGTTAFNSTSFILENKNSVAAAIQINKNLINKTVPLQTIDRQTLLSKQTDIPTEVKAVATSREGGKDTIVVTWKGTARGSNGYSIYRKTARETKYKHIKDVSASVTTFIDKTVVPNTTYTYKIKTWTSGFSEESAPMRIGPKEKKMNTVFGEIEL